MDRSLITKNIRRPNRLGHLFTRRRWNKLRDAVKNKIYKINNENSLNNIIHEANVDERENTKYVPSENVRYTNELAPLTHATLFNPSQNIDNYGYDDNVNLGEPVKIGTVEGNIKDTFMSRIESTIMRRRSLPPIEPIPDQSSPERQITKNHAGSKLNQRISSKRKNKHVKKTYKKKMYKI
jgi:hypothetical protein